MSDTALRLYHRLPAPARTVAASLRGFQLRSWRYGPETERLADEALERERWNAERWRQWQEESLARILERAATQVPYYREQWDARRRLGDRASHERLENWPVLDKEQLKAHPHAFIADGRDVRRMFHDHTSGTSGKSLDLWLSRDAVRFWYALFEARCRRWYGVSRHDRWAMLGGQLVAPTQQRKPPFWVWNAALNQLYMSSYHLAPDLIAFYLRALQQHRIKYLLGYASALYELAEGALRLKQQVQMKVAIVNAEPLFDYQRCAIEEAFQCPVRETYGMAETVAAASECESGVLHLWPEAGYIEVLEEGQPVANGLAGELVATGLVNADMPLIRYRTGDRVALSRKQTPCACGRALPALAFVEGRMDDLLYTPDGRRIGRLDPVFKEQLPVSEAQIIQERLGQIRVRYVPAPNFTTSAGASIVEKVRARMGDVKVILEEVERVPRGANGKFHAVICQLPREQKESLQTKNAGATNNRSLEK